MPSTDIIPIERIAASIHLLRGHKVMIDSDLAGLYGVETKTFNQAVRRNMNRFPDDFMFQLTNEEAENLRSQSVTSSWGGRRYNPYAFTEQGVAMLSSVLRSHRAVEVNIAIVRTFVKLRQILAGNEELARTLAKHDNADTTPLTKRLCRRLQRVLPLRRRADRRRRTRPRHGLHRHAPFPALIINVLV